jgi:CBS domain-containing protein
MHVAAILKSKGPTIITVKPDTTVDQAARLLAVNRIGAVLVVDPDNELAGILSERDIIRGLSEKGPAILQSMVQDIMTRRVVTCRPEDSVAVLMTRMTEGRFRHLPVLDAGRLVGMISIGDVVKHRLEEQAAEVESMRDYVAGKM